MLFAANCLDVFPKMEKKSVDIFVTSPPYNLGIKYNSYKDDNEYDEYLFFIKEVCQKIFIILKDNGSFFLNVGSSNKNPWLYMDVANVAREFFVLQNDFVWVKSISIGDETHGQFKPINSKRYVNGLYEHVFHFTHKGNVPLDRKSIGVPYVYKNNITRHNKTEGYMKEDLRCRGNVWHIPYKTIQSKSEKGNHPAIFPEKLVEHCIKLHGYNNETVVCDPFVGHGTTVLVCKKLGIEYIGIDIDEKYIEEIKMLLHLEDLIYENIAETFKELGRKGLRDLRENEI